MKKLINTLLVLFLISSASYAIVDTSFSGEEDYCLYQSVLKMGYCNEIEIEGEDVTVKRCQGANMQAPNPENKKVCSGNALQPI